MVKYARQRRNLLHGHVRACMYVSEFDNYKYKNNDTCMRNATTTTTITSNYRCHPHPNQQQAYVAASSQLVVVVRMLIDDLCRPFNMTKLREFDTDLNTSRGG